MLFSLQIWLSLTLRFVPVFSRALDSVPQVQDGFSRSLSPSRLTSLEAQFASWDPAALGTSAASPTITAALNASDPFSALLNTTQKPLGAQVYQCNGDLYGRQLSSISCIRALMFLPDMSMKFSFGPKAQGQWNFEVPYRILSGESSGKIPVSEIEINAASMLLTGLLGDGLCAIDLELNSNALSDRARGTDLIKAGQWLLTACFADHQQGGIIRNLGNKNPICPVISTSLNTNEIRRQRTHQHNHQDLHAKRPMQLWNFFPKLWRLSEHHRQAIAE